MSYLQGRRARSLEAAASVDAAELLVILMSEISEDHYCAGWLMGLEFTLWAMVQGGDRRFGFGDVSEERVNKLRELHERAGGWWCWDEEGKQGDCGEVFVATKDWKERYAKESH